MLKIFVIFYLKYATILATITTLYETPEAYMEWKIKNFFDLPAEVGYSLNSTAFSLANIKWYLRIYPNGQSHVSDGYIGVHLGNAVYEEKKYRIDFKLGFKKQDGSEFEPQQTEYTFNEKYVFWGFPKLIKRSKLLTWKDTVVPAGTLTVFCKLRFMNRIEIMPQLSSSSGIETLSNHLKDMYTSQRFADYKLIVKDREFSVHKNILSYRIPGINSKLEKNPDKFEITDCEPDEFEKILHYIYTGKLNDMSSKTAMSLYLVADNYGMHEIKDDCIRYMADHDLNIDTFYDIFHFANLHSNSMLLMATTDFFNTNAKLILSTEKWKKFLVDNPLQGNELFLAYVEKKN